MGAIKPTRMSRLSTGWVTSTQSITDKNSQDSVNPDFSCINGAATSTFSVGGALTQGGAATYLSTLSAAGAGTFQSTLTVRGQLNADSGVQVGGGAVINVISTGTVALSFGAIAGQQASASVLTFGVSGLSRGDALWLTPDSIFANVAGNRFFNFYASSSSTVGEANAWASNVSSATLTPTASTYFRWVRIKGGAFPAA